MAMAYGRSSWLLSSSCEECSFFRSPVFSFGVFRTICPVSPITSFGQVSVRLDRYPVDKLFSLICMWPQLSDPRSIGEALKGSRLGAFWKYRVGDYCIIASIEDKFCVSSWYVLATARRCTGRVLVDAVPNECL